MTLEQDVGGGCLVCGAMPAVTTGRVGCTACGATFRLGADGWLGAIDEPSAVGYPEDAADLTAAVEDSSFWFRHRNRIVAAVLDRYPPGGTVWDVGGGNGYQALHLERLGHAVTVVEPGEAGCRNARRRGVRTVLRATLEGLHLPAGRLAAISLLDVIEHLDDPRALLAECRRVLGPGRRLYVTVPALGLLWSDEDVYARHARRYTYAGLRRELERAGFAVEYESYCFQVLVVPIFLLRAMPYRARLSARTTSETMNPHDHAPARGLRALLERLLDREYETIRRGRTLRIGSSLIAVAHAP